MAMTLQVSVEGFAPYEVEDQWMVKAKDTQAISGSIPGQNAHYAELATNAAASPVSPIGA